MLALLAIVGALSITGCVSVPKSLHELVSAEGALMTSVLRLGPVMLIRTASVIPGHQNYERDNAQVTQCRGQQLRLTVETPSASVVSPDASCRYLLASVMYAARNLGIAKVDLEIRINLVPQGYFIHRRDRFWVFGGTPRTAYWIPLLDSEGESLANMVSSIAHETTHLLAFTTGMPATIATNERAGHLAGACAELEILGEIKRDRLSLGYFNEKLELSSEITDSSRSGAIVSRDLLPFFDQASVVALGTPAGQRMRAYCHSELSKIIQR
ncbi:hypothetical protein [Luteimonas salinilitoris]